MFKSYELDPSLRRRLVPIEARSALRSIQSLIVILLLFGQTTKLDLINPLVCPWISSTIVSFLMDGSIFLFKCGSIILIGGIIVYFWTVITVQLIRFQPIKLSTDCLSNTLLYGNLFILSANLFILIAPLLIDISLLFQINLMIMMTDVSHTLQIVL